MKKPEKEITVDLAHLSLDGEVLDMGFESRGAIYRALKQRITSDTHFETAASMDIRADMEDCQWVYGDPAALPFNDGNFDAVTAFFSMSFLKRKYMINKAVKEIWRTLKAGGKLYIWDINSNFSIVKSGKIIKVILKGGDEITFELAEDRIPWDFTIHSMVPVISRYFNIVEKRDLGGYFYIEAMKKDDAI